MKMTFQPKKRHRAKEHGFRKRMQTASAVMSSNAAGSREENSSALEDRKPLWSFFFLSGRCEDSI